MMATNYSNSSTVPDYVNYTDCGYYELEEVDVVFNDFGQSKHDFFRTRKVQKHSKPECMKKWKRYKI